MNKSSSSFVAAYFVMLTTGSFLYFSPTTLLRRVNNYPINMVGRKETTITGIFCVFSSP